ncbi:hypothetical protein Tco_1340069 [Tanacetum coccineum]
MTDFPEISRRARDKYHNLDDDMMVKNTFNLGKHNDEVGMKILSWMITDEMKHTENYRMYVAVFGVDVPTKSSAPRKSTVIRLRIPQRQSTRLTPPTQIPTNAEADDIILQDIIQLSLAEQKSHDEVEAKQNVQKVEEHLIAEEIEKLVEGAEIRRMLEPRSDKESPEVEITVVAQPVNVIEEEEESAEDDYVLRQREKGKNVEESRNTPSPTTTRSPRTHSTLISLDTKKL